jgi:DNA-binding CsgD family transcriptional regulator
VQKAAQGSAGGQRSVLRLRVPGTKPPTEMLALITPLHGEHSDGLLNYYKNNSDIGNKNKREAANSSHIDSQLQSPNLAAIQLQKSTLIAPAILCLVARSYKLTPAEELVLSLLCDGLDVPDVASTLNVAVSTVRSHVRGLCGKMQATSIRQLVLRVALLPGVVGVVGVRGLD